MDDKAIYTPHVEKGFASFDDKAVITKKKFPAKEFPDFMPKEERMAKRPFDGSEKRIGRPIGRRDFYTVQKEAIIKLAKELGENPQEVEVLIVEMGIRKALEGDYKFYEDFMNRTFGKVPDQHLNLNMKMEPSERIKDLAKLLNTETKTKVVIEKEI